MLFRLPRPALVALIAALFVAAAALLPPPHRDPVAHAEAELTRGIVVGWTVGAHTHPWASADVVHYFTPGTELSIRGVEYGENWIVGDQTWYMVPPDWANSWYVLDDGSYVYAAFVFIPSDLEVEPWHREPGLERYVIVDLSDQIAWVMLGSNVMHAAPVSTGYGQFATPTGEFTIYPWGRTVSAHMTSSGAGFDDSVEPYDVQRVLFTQYFAAGGFALHMNYWQPDSVFGRTPSSHGCVGMQLHDAQYLWLFGYAGMRVVVRP